MFGPRCRVQIPSKPILGTFLCVTIALFPSTSSHAGYVVNNLSGESVSFALWNTNAGAFGSPVWSSDPKTPNMLLSAGPLAAGSPPGTFPTIPYPGLLAVKTQGNTFTLPSGTGAFSNSNSSDPALLNPHTYGSSTVKGAVSNNLASRGSGVNNVVGTSFNAGTFLQAGDQMAGATAAVTYAHIHGDFTYTGSTIAARIGSILSASGFVTTNGFVELANVGTIKVGSASYSFSMVVAGSLDAAGNFSQLSNGPISTNYLGDGDFTVAGSYTAPSAISIPNGTKITIDSYLTMIADPGSLIELTSNGLPLSEVPDIVTAFGGPVGGTVPEPGTVIQLGTGLLLSAGVLGWRRRGRMGGFLRDRGRIRGMFGGLFALSLVLLNAGHASAASVTIDNLGLVPSVQVGAFNGYKNLTGLADTVDFDGTYLSAGGGPAPGESVSYTVVFTRDHGATDTALTEITIKGLSATDTAIRTEVLVHFEGILTSPVPPGSGIYFTPEPAGYFDVAAYLVKQSAPNVPGDLSVRVRVSAIPEPASLVTSCLGLLLAGVWGLNRRSDISRSMS